jgi:2Fe-2S ferredoxin
MPKVTFKPDDLTVEVEAGSKLIDIVEECGSSLLFGCRQALCGTCIMTVLEGGENLNPITDDEKITLDGHEAQPGQRLGCQCTVNGDIVIDYIA